MRNVGVKLRAAILTAWSTTLIPACAGPPQVIEESAWGLSRERSAAVTSRSATQAVGEPPQSVSVPTDNGRAAPDAVSQVESAEKSGILGAGRAPEMMRLPGIRLQNGSLLEGNDVLAHLARMGKPAEQGLTFAATAGDAGSGVSLTLAELLTSSASLRYDTRLGQFVSVTPSDGNVPGISNALFGPDVSGKAFPPPDGASQVNEGAGSLIGLDGSTLIGLDGSTLVPGPQPGVGERKGSPLTPEDAGGPQQAVMVGYPYFASDMPAAKYRLTQQTQGAPAAPQERMTAGDVLEVLLPGQTAVRAISLQGEPVTDWALTGSSGAFVLPLPPQLPPIFFVLALAPLDDASVLQTMGLGFSAGSERGPVLIPLDSASTMVTGELLYILDYAPKEIARLQKVLKKLKPTSKRRPKALARMAELEAALRVLNPLYYADDLQQAERIVDKEDASGLNRAKALLELYEVAAKARKKKNADPPKSLQTIISRSIEELQSIPPEEFIVDVNVGNNEYGYEDATIN